MHSLKTLLSQAFEKSYLSYFNFHVEDILIGFQSISVRMKTTYLTNAAGKINQK